MKRNFHHLKITTLMFLFESIMFTMSTNNKKS